MRFTMERSQPKGLEVELVRLPSGDDGILLHPPVARREGTESDAIILAAGDVQEVLTRIRDSYVAQRSVIHPRVLSALPHPPP